MRPASGFIDWHCGVPAGAAALAGFDNHAMSSHQTPLRWEIFCRVIDNHGDLGVCWRLARRLMTLGAASVRLWIDDAGALAWMAPAGEPGVTVQPWREPLPHEVPGDVVIEAFGCDPPPAFVALMAAQQPPPIWINLEYLSAETYVARSHGLVSPQQSGPGRGLWKWFFYPGFTTDTGGLLLEDGLIAARAAHDTDAWLAERGLASARGTRRISLFCYEQPALAGWLDAWSAPLAPPNTLYLTPGHATRQASAWLRSPIASGDRIQRGPLELCALPWLSQPDYDRLLWSCDLNLVRGEDSLIRALWAARPLVWQIYPQHDGAHLAKLEAFFDRYFGTAADAPLRAAWRHWNDPGAPPAASTALFSATSRAEAIAATARLAAQQAATGDLGSRLYAFVSAQR